MPLTDTAIRKTKKGGKAFKKFDERGLFLLVTQAGAKLWRLKYRFAGKEKLLALGSYPDVSLKTARELRDEARKQVAAGIDPSAQRRAEKQATADSFEAVAHEWHDRMKASRADSYNRVILSRLENNVIPFLGSKPIREITPPEILAVLRKVEARGAYESAHRTKQVISMVYRYAIASGRAESDPSRDLAGALVPAIGEHFPAVTTPQEFAGLLRALDGYKGSPVVRAALQLAPLAFVRPGELRKAEWQEINLDEAKWTLPGWRMKMKQPLIVPLSRQAAAILRDLQPLTGAGRYVFPSARGGDRPMSDNAVLAAMRRCGIPKEEHVGHGFRATARTILDEVLGFRVDLIEHQLGHAVKDPNGRAYNRTSFWPDRIEMMQQWADYLDSLKNAKPQAAGGHSA